MKKNSSTGQSLWSGLPRPSKESRMAFLSAMVSGFVVHLFVFSNLIINHDGAVSIRSANDHLTSGRWALSFFSRFSGIYELPVVLAFLTVFALACTAALTVQVLEIKEPIGILLVSGFLVSFPSVACIFPYLYTADAYFFALLLNAAGAWAAKRWRFGWIPAAACLALSLGIYQAFICYGVGLLLFDCIFALYHNQKIGDVCRRGVRYLLAIALSLAAYRVILAVRLAQAGLELSSYRGMDGAINSGVMDYLRAVPNAYLEFFRFLWNPSYISGWVRRFQLLLFCFALCCGVFLVVVRKLYRDLPRLGLMLVGVALIPPALNLISIIAAGSTQTNIVQRYAFVLAFVFIVKLIELTVRQCMELFGIPKKREKPEKGFGLAGLAARFWRVPVFGGLLLCAWLIWENFLVTNAGYLHMQMVYENSYATANRILTHVEAMEEYQPDTPVVLAGSAKYINNNISLFPELSQFSGMDTSLLNTYCGGSFIHVFLGANKPSATPEQRQELLESGVLDEMPCYPAKGSIQFYDGMILVKLSDNYRYDLERFPG